MLLYVLLECHGTRCGKLLVVLYGAFYRCQSYYLNHTDIGCGVGKYLAGYVYDAVERGGI